MSQLADLCDTFKDFQNKYNWTDKETAKNFTNVVQDLEWGISYEEVKEFFVKEEK